MILGRCCFPKVCPSRVRRLAVDIADFGVRPLVSHVKPSKATRRIRPTTNANLIVTPPVFCAGYGANGSATASAHLPTKYPSSRRVTQDFAKSFCGQHRQPKYFSKRTVNIGKSTKGPNSLSLAMLGMRHSSCRRTKHSANGPRNRERLRISDLTLMALVGMRASPCRAGGPSGFNSKRTWLAGLALT